MIASLWTYLHSKPGLTWIGHGLQGFWWGVFADIWPFSHWLAVIFLVIMFGVREGEGIVVSIAKGDAPNILDGVLDLVTPFVGLLIYVLINP